MIEEKKHYMRNLNISGLKGRRGVEGSAGGDGGGGRVEGRGVEGGG